LRLHSNYVLYFELKDTESKVCYSQGRQKNMCLAAASGVVVAAAKLLLARWESGYID